MDADWDVWTLKRNQVDNDSHMIEEAGRALHLWQEWQPLR